MCSCLTTNSMAENTLFSVQLILSSTNLSLISFPGHEAALCVDVPEKNMSSVGGSEQKGVHVVAQSRLLHITDFCW